MKTKKIYNINVLIFLIFFIFTTSHTMNKDIDVETSYNIEMPPFGKFKIYGIVDIQNQEFTLKGGPQKKHFNLGLLTIENPFIQITNKKGFGAQADVTIFNQKGTIGVLEFKPGKRIIYNITPSNKIEIPITPWNKTTINELTLLITPDVFELGSTVQIFGKSNLLKFGKKRENKQTNEESQPSIELEESNKTPENYAELILKKIRPSDIIQDIYGHKFNEIIFEEAKLKINNPFSKKTDHKITIDAITNLENLHLPLNVNLSKIKSLITIDKITGLTLEAEIPNLKIMENSQFKELYLKIILPPKIKNQTEEENTERISDQTTNESQSISKNTNKPSMFLYGKTDLNLPLVGNVNGDFSAIYEQGKFNFETKIEHPVSFENKITLNNVTLKYSTIGNFEIIGNTRIFDMELVGKLKLSKTAPQKESSATTETENNNETQIESDQSPTISQEAQTEEENNESNQSEEQNNTEEAVNTPEQKYLKIGSYFIEFSATSKINKPIKPFSKIPGIQNIKQLADISISDPGLGMKPDKTFYITGQSDILGFKANVQLEIQNKNEITLKSRAPKNWRLSDAIKSLKGTAFDEMDLSEIQIIITSFQHFDNKLNMKLNKGINLIANAKLTGGKFNSAKELISTLNEKLRVAGSIGSSPSEIYFSMSIPVKEIKIGDKAILKNISFFVSGDGPSIGLKTQILITPSKQDNSLLFIGSVSIDPTKAGGTLSATMLGDWINPLGINGLTLSDVAVEGTLPSLTNLGITGNLLIGNDKKIKIAAAYSIDGQIVLLGEFAGKILLDDLISMAIKSNKNINFNKLKTSLPEIGFENNLFKFAPRKTKIGEINFDPGISLKGTLIILNKRGLIDLNLGSEGIFARGTLDKFNIGPIEISGSGLDEIYGTADDGPVIDLALCQEAQHLIISGLLDLKIAKGEADIHIGSDNIRIFLLAQLLKKFETQIEAYSVGSIKKPNELDFIFKATATNEMNEYLIKQITSGLTLFNEKSKDKIEKAQQKVDNLNIKIKEIKDKIKDRNNKILMLKKEYKQIQEATKQYLK